MRKIGIIDYFIDEWHANEYLGLFKKANEELGLDFEIAYGWAEINKEGRLTTEEWCAKNGITRCETIEEVCEKSDNLLILAPANPETHLGYAKIALSYGKTTYIDKTFAPDLQTAKEIFAIAKQYGTKIFTTSALRYAEELDGLENVEGLFVTGGGGNVREYIIHQIEMAVKVMGENADTAWVFNGVNQTAITLAFGKKIVTLNYSNSDCGFSVDAKQSGVWASSYRRMLTGSYFYRLAKSILSFFATGEQPFDPNQTLCVLAIRDAIVKGLESENGRKIAVEKI